MFHKSSSPTSSSQFFILFYQNFPYSLPKQFFICICMLIHFHCKVLVYLLFTLLHLLILSFPFYKFSIQLSFSPILPCTFFPLNCKFNYTFSLLTSLGSFSLLLQSHTLPLHCQPWSSSKIYLSSLASSRALVYSSFYCCFLNFLFLILLAGESM